MSIQRNVILACILAVGLTVSHALPANAEPTKILEFKREKFKAYEKVGGKSEVRMAKDAELPLEILEISPKGFFRVKVRKTDSDVWVRKLETVTNEDVNVEVNCQKIAGKAATSRGFGNCFE